jgi:HTH-type transcriptional regulator/antitoxin HipB
MAVLKRSTIASAAELGRIVRARRLEQGLTQTGLGELALVGPRFVGELERGKPSLHLDKVLAVLIVLGIAVSLEYPEAP